MSEFINPLEREYFIGTETECDAFIVKMDTLHGYSNTEVKTDTYSKPREHSTKSGTYLVPLKAVYAPKLRSNSSLQMIDNEMTAGQRTKKLTLSTLRTENAFPKGML